MYRISNSFKIAERSEGAMKLTITDNLPLFAANADC
jgi:hypothetical protein